MSEILEESISTKDYCKAKYEEFFGVIADKVVEELEDASAKGVTFVTYIAPSVEEGDMVIGWLRSSKHCLFTKKVGLCNATVSFWEGFFGLSAENQAKYDGRYYHVSFNSLS